MRVLVLILICAISGNVLGYDDRRLTRERHPGSQRFRMFDATLHEGKPDLVGYGLAEICVIYESGIFEERSRPSDMPNRSKVKRKAEEAVSQGNLAVIDIERWPYTGRGKELSDGLEKYSEVVRWIKSDVPTLKVGYYGLPPVRDYWRAIRDPKAPEYKQWQADNDQLRQLASHLDVLFPSAYTFYDDPEGWVKYARAQIEEAKRFGKPTYVFLWPQFHESNRRLGGQYIPPKFWRLQLETAFQFADGVVIWGGWDLEKNRPMAWHEDAAWWQETKAFVKQKGISVQH